MNGSTTGGLVLGIFAFLLGAAAIFAALRRRRGRAKYPETYAASGGIVYTAVSMGCGVVLLLAGLGIIVLAFVYKR